MFRYIEATFLQYIDEMRRYMHSVNSDLREKALKVGADFKI